MIKTTPAPSSFRKTVANAIKNRHISFCGCAAEIGITYRTLRKFLEGGGICNSTMKKIEAWVSGAIESAEPAWRLEGVKLKQALASEWAEWGRESGLETFIPGGKAAIEDYISGKSCNPETLKALKLQMGFASPAEEQAYQRVEAWRRSGQQERRYRLRAPGAAGRKARGAARR